MRLFYLYTCLILFFVSCNKKEESDVVKPINSFKLRDLPYNSLEPFPWKLPDNQALLTSLQMHKAWEIGDMKMMRETLADTITMYVANGGRFTGNSDSLIILDLTEVRSNLKRVQFIFDKYIAYNSETDGPTCVSLWYKEINTQNDGEKDSLSIQEDNKIDKNGKIYFVSSHRQRFTLKQ